MSAYEKLETLKVRVENGVCYLALNRPDIRNAFNETMISELQNTFELISKDPEVRLVLFSGEGPVFCAGGDLNWMKNSMSLSAAENLEDTRRLTLMFDSLNNCPKPVVGLVHGGVIGGGVGLVSICDYVIASRETQFSLAEVRLGIIPACIGPFVMAKIGSSQARAYFISAKRFNADRAREIGLVHEVLDVPSDLPEAGERLARNLLQCGPNAVAAAKSLIHNISDLEHEKCLEYVAKCLADLRISPEGQEGLKSFLEKRQPNWAKNSRISDG